MFNFQLIHFLLGIHTIKIHQYLVTHYIKTSTNGLIFLNKKILKNNLNKLFIFYDILIRLINIL